MKKIILTLTMALVATNTIKVGNHVTTTEPQGDVNFSHGSYHLAGKRVELHPGTKISVGTTMKISNR